VKALAGRAFLRSAVIACLLAAWPGHAQAVDPARLALGRQVIAIMYPPETRDAMMASMVEALMAQIRSGTHLPAMFSDPGLKAIMDRAFNAMPARLMPVISRNLPRMHEAIATAYAREFTAAELSEIVAFGRTPTGRRYFQQSGSLLADRDVAAANTAYIGEAQQLNQQFTAQVRQEVTDYLGKHPELLNKAAPAQH
jgi:hypothetical protein